jgi:hypothetical protein
MWSQWCFKNMNSLPSYPNTHTHTHTHTHTPHIHTQPQIYLLTNLSSFLQHLGQKTKPFI